MTMNKHAEEKFVEAIRSHLDASVDDLDLTLVSRLDDARNDAFKLANILVDESLDTAEEHLVTEVQKTLNANSALSPGIELRLSQIRQQALARLEISAPAKQRSEGQLASQTIGGDSQNNLQSNFKSGLAKIRALLNGSSYSAPAGMFATACVLLTVASLFYVAGRPIGSQPNASLPVEKEISLISSADDIELYENLEFYLWLADSGLDTGFDTSPGNNSLNNRLLN